MESDLIDLFNEIHSIPILVNVLSILMTCTFASYAIFFSRGGASAKHLGVQKYFCGAWSPLHRVHAPENSFLVSIVTFSFEP